MVDLAVDPFDGSRVVLATRGDGLLEFVPAPLFADGFETGDVSAWSVLAE